MTPTPAPLEGRIIPAGQPLPAGPTLPPGTPDPPPWRTVATPPPASHPPATTTPPQPPAPQPQTVTVIVDYREPPAPPGPSRWQRARARIRPWLALAAAATALTPIPWTGYSLATTWQATVHYGRTITLPLGYAVAAAGILLALLALHRTRGAVGDFAARVAAITALVGLTGAIHWWDPIHALTGVPL